MRSALVPGLLFATFACAGSSQPTPAAAPRAAEPAPAPRTVSYSAGTTRYRLVSHVHQEQQIEGNTQQLNFLLEYLVTVTLTPGGMGGLNLALVVDSIRAEGGLLGPVELARAKGVRLTGVLTPDGRVNELSGDSVLTGQLQSIATAVRQFFPRLPESGATPGSQWSDTSVVETKGSPQLSFQFMNDRTIGDWIQQAGQRMLPIKVTSNYSVTGSGQQMGQDYTLNGTGTRFTDAWIAADGRYHGAVARDSSNITVTLSSLGISFPSIQSRSDTVTVIP